MLIALVAAAVLAAAPMESFVEAPGPEGPLKGTMLWPGSGPVVLIIPGSGPTDRDGDSPLGVRASTYRLLGEELARHGIGSVRIDKRGMFASTAAVKDANAVTIQDYADDVHAWVRTIRSRTTAPCVWLLGHSEGGLVALAAAQDDPGVCGLVLAATAGRPFDAVLRAQLEANPANAPLLEQANASIAKLKAGSRVDAGQLAAPLAALFRPEVQGFLIDAFAHDPAALIGSVRKPVLILQGERDLQVSRADAERLAQANPRASMVLLPATNHVLKTVNGDDRRANAATYADPSLPLAPGVAEAIASFIKAHTAAP